MQLHNLVQRKFIQSYDISDYQILTDTGWEDISAIHKTIPYKKYKLVTEKNELICADTHIVFLKNYQEIFVKDLLPNTEILTKSGKQKVISVICLNEQQNMYDITVNSNYHRFYSNNILSHNSTSYSIFVLWYILMNQDKSVLICANKFKTAKDILQRVKMAYQMLPSWLKPGIITWNASSIEFSNGCKVTAEATSESSGRRRFY